MSTFVKRLFLIIIGISAGLAAWPFAEFIIHFQYIFPSYLFFTIFLGLIFGLLIGAFFSTNEGITQNKKSKIISGVITGIIIGALGGAVGFLIGQFILFLLGQWIIYSVKDFNKFGLPVSRAVSWAVLGLFIGIIEGVRSKSAKKIKIGLIGGFIGGLLGGLTMEYFQVIIENIIFARLAGLMVFGLLIGLFYGIIEKNLSNGILRLLNGQFKGKEYLINQNRIKIGASKRNDIILDSYEGIDDKHAQLRIKKDEIIIKSINGNSPIFVNDERVDEQRLKIEDVIKIGNAKFLYKFK